MLARLLQKYTCDMQKLTSLLTLRRITVVQFHLQSDQKLFFCSYKTQLPRLERETLS